MSRRVVLYLKSRKFYIFIFIITGGINIMQSNNIDENTNKRSYTVNEIAALLQISKSKAYELCKQNIFRIIKVGRSVRISKNSFDEWLDCQNDNIEKQ
jgi:excisionase family DNA binding protein